jgi:hypothetical protein
MPGVGLHDVAMGDQRSAPSQEPPRKGSLPESHKGSPPSEPRKGYCGLAGTPFTFTAQ